MSTASVPAIDGVSPSSETILKVIYPSVSATGIGRLIGRLMESIPIRIMGIKLSHLLFGLPLAPLGALIYLGLKAVGEKYVLTTRSVGQWRSLGARLIRQVPLSEIADVQIEERPGQEFFRAGDVTFLRADGTVALELPGVGRPEVFRRYILEARDARHQTEAALATIRARQA